ncbi:hypothetical protein Vretimale_8929 [Volvox reticuliferus]|uniref:Uncharacterized protein n=1 Tax=Volvox reticuliferus TaxID=1737510 RepID=A0A8J4GCG2_9CHLO|nr:hypothetical protein Vretimale_8929 [Volvox reticuliferus]
MRCAVSGKACNALLLPDLERRVVHHVMQLMTAAKSKKESKNKNVRPSCRHSQSKFEPGLGTSSAGVLAESMSSGARKVRQTSVPSSSRPPPTLSPPFSPRSAAPAEVEATAPVVYPPDSTAPAADRFAGSGERGGIGSRLAVGCLLTAMRDGAVLQLQWLVTTALEELTRQYGSVEARQAAEWDELPGGLQHAALDRWARRARAVKVPTSSSEMGRQGVVAGKRLVVTPAAATKLAPNMAGPGAGVGAARDSGNQSRPPSSGDAPGPDGGGEARGDGVGLLGAMRRLALVMARGPDDGGVAYPE